MRKNLKTKYGANLKMNDDVYALRRKVMQFVYEAKVLTLNKMKRVDVRIIENNKEGVAGVARMAARIIWIPESYANNLTGKLRQVVFHELLHAVYNIDHNEKCDLMCANVSAQINEKMQNKIFLSYIKSN